MLLSSSEPPTTPAAAAAAVPRNEPPPPPAAAARHRAGRHRCLTVCGPDRMSGRWACCNTWPLFQAGRLGGFGRRNVRDRAALLDFARRSCRASNRGSRRIGSVAGAPPASSSWMRLVGALERLVLHQNRLHQRVNRVGRAPQALRDRGGSVRIARRALHAWRAGRKDRQPIGVLAASWRLSSLRERGRDVGGALCRK